MREMVEAHGRRALVVNGLHEEVRLQHEAELDAAQLEVAEWQAKLQQKHNDALQAMLRVRAEDDVRIKAVRGEAAAWEQAFHQQRKMAEEHSLELAQFKVQSATQLQRIQASSPSARGQTSLLHTPVRAAPGGFAEDTLEGRLQAAGLQQYQKPLQDAGYDALDLMSAMNEKEWLELAQELGSAIDEQSLAELRACVAAPPAHADRTASPRRDLVADLTANPRDETQSIEQMAERVVVAEKLMAEAIRAKADAEAGVEARTRALRVENAQLKRDQLQLKADLARKVDSYLLELI